MENEEIILKRAFFGGFDRKQVMEYISYLHSKTNAYEEELEELKSIVAELETEIREKDDMIAKLNSAVAEAESNTRLNRASAALMKESAAYAESYIEGAKVLARDISEKTASRVENARNKINGILDYLGDISDSIMALYSSMDSLKSEYENFGDVYPEAEIHVIYPDLEAEKTESVTEEVQTDEITEVLSDESDPFPTEEDMADFLLRMEEKYRAMLNS